MLKSTRNLLVRAACIATALFSIQPGSRSQKIWDQTLGKPDKLEAGKPLGRVKSVSEAFTLAINYVKNTNPLINFDKGKWKITITGEKKRHRWRFYFWPTPGPPGGDFSVLVYDDGKVKKMSYL